MSLLNSNGVPLWLPGANAALGEGGINARVNSVKLNSRGDLVLTLDNNQTVTIQDAGQLGLSAITAQLTSSWTAAAETDRRNKHK